MTDVAPSEMLLFIRGEAGRGNVGFMGQFAFTRASAQITSALIRLPKWGPLTTRRQPTTEQAFVYILLYFSPAICFDGPILKHEGFEALKCFTTVAQYF